MRVKYWIHRLRQLIGYYASSGIVVVSCSGQATKRPQVHVSVCSRYGSQGVYTWYYDENGHAMADLYGPSLAAILNIPYFDERTQEERNDNRSSHAIGLDGAR